MTKAIRFSFHSTRFEHVQASESFTFEELLIDEQLTDEALEKEVERLYQAWVWNKLNLEKSIILDRTSLPNQRRHEHEK